MGSSSATGTELETRVHQQDILAKLGSRALESGDPDRLLEDATDEIVASLEADHCHVLELHPNGEQLRSRAGIGADPAPIEPTMRSTASDGLFGYTLRSDEPVLVPDFGTEDRFSVTSSHVDRGVVSAITVRIGSSDDPWGVLGTYATEPRAFTEHDARFLENVAQLLSSGLDDRQTTSERDTDLADERILETCPVGITAIDSDGGIVFANEYATDVLGGPAGDLPGCVDDESWGFAGPDGNAVSVNEIPYTRAKRTGEPVTEEVLGITNDEGTRVWLSVDCMPLFDDDGTFKGAICAMTDVTDRKELEGRLEEILGRIDDAFCAFDDDLRYTLVNDRAEELLTHSEDELLGNTIWEMFPEATDDPNVRESFETALETNEPTSYQHYYEPLGNWIEGNIYPSETGVSVYFRDITERKEYQQRLERSNERLEQFAYAASHDLQEPLRMVTSYLNLIDRRYGDDLEDDAQEFLAFAVDGAERMREMIDGLLEYSRVETRGESFDLVDLNDVFADARRDLMVQIEETDAQITVDSLPVVEGDGNQLRQVLQNLLSNALEYSGQNPPRIDVSATREGDTWKLHVRDNGVGIEPSNEDRIFQVFQRVSDGDDQAGSGIGLALCKRIIERHGGRIDVDSEPGEGSVFTVTLPVATD
ncbi:histidine kinase [Halostagnicola larsenii XH-48]|uniref:histidine kinase n=1 Tax=Halostagnicola larsenii XH-48 TaxID=797299 RepID=W0JTQ6_9EURY|nr:ATP-binding protein [Halostagnicola larsenii]AHG00692.1 histidine kinase [Halostagnicola larsenii XH-48]